MAPVLCTPVEALPLASTDLEFKVFHFSRQTAIDGAE